MCYKLSIFSYFQTRYYMCCENVYNLNIQISSDETTDKTVFQRTGNYGSNWNYGQVTFNETGKFKVCKILCNFYLYFFIMYEYTLQ